MLNRSRIDIACCFDHNYVIPQGVMMQSLCVNNKELEIVFHLIVDESVTQQDKEDLCEITARFLTIKVEFYCLDSSFFSSLPRSKRRILPPSVYYRLYLSEILPKSIKKVLYLDCDMIIRHSLFPLWNTDISGVALAGIPDVISGDEISERLGYPSQLNYFNAGVLLINLEYWRSQNVLSDFLDCIRNKGDKLYYYDQDVLNFVFRGNKILLPIKYNLISSFLFTYRQDFRDMYSSQMNDALQDPVIVHFTIWTKPWQRTADSPRVLHPFAKEFRYYQDQTKWKGIFIDLRTTKTRIRQFLGDIARKIGLKKPLPNIYIPLSR